MPFPVLSLPLSAVFPCLSWLANISLKRATIHLPGNFHHSQVQQNDLLVWKKRKKRWMRRMNIEDIWKSTKGKWFISQCHFNEDSCVFVYIRAIQKQKKYNIGWLILRYIVFLCQTMYPLYSVLPFECCCFDSTLFTSPFNALPFWQDS